MSQDSLRIQDALGYYGEDWVEKACEAIEKYRRFSSRAVVYDISTVGNRIRTAREAAGMSIVQLARRMGISATMVSLCEHGKRPIAMRRVPGLAICLHVSRDWLLMLSDDGGPKLRNGILRRFKGTPTDPARSRLSRQYREAAAEVSRRNKERRENAKRA